MKKLKTPFGEIIVKIDDQEVEYKFKKCENDPTNNDGHDRDVETWYGSDLCYLIK